MKTVAFAGAGFKSFYRTVTKKAARLPAARNGTNGRDKFPCILRLFFLAVMKEAAKARAEAVSRTKSMRDTP